MIYYMYYFSNHSDITPTALNDTTNIKSRTLSDQWSFHHGLYSYGTFAEAVPVCLTYYSNGKRYKSGPKTHVCKASRVMAIEFKLVHFQFGVTLNTSRIEDLIIFVHETPNSMRSVTRRFGGELIYFPLSEEMTRPGVVITSMFEISTIKKVCNK